MKSKIIKITSLLLVISLVTISLISGISNANGFSDLKPTHWCFEKIMKFLDNGYVSGYEDGTFRADRTITRAEYVKIVNNFFGYSVDNENINLEFSDVSEKDWFAGYVSEAVRRGYITGYPDGTFRPHEPLRRQEATVILSRILGIDKEVYPEDHVDGMIQYSDGKEIEDWAYVAVHSYSVYNFINGYTDGTIKILQNVTRAETVELLNILEEKIEIEREENNKKPGGGGGGTKVKKVDSPIIKAYELVNEKETIVDEWVNSETKFEQEEKVGALIKISCSVEGATIYYQLNGGTKQTYVEPFILADGKASEIKAWAQKKYMADSSISKLIVNVDTVSPIANGVLDEEKNEVTVSVKDYDFYAIGENRLSGVSGDSLKYAWFTLNKAGNDYVRETLWTKFTNDSRIGAPQNPGIYYLGVMGSDIAENKIGAGKYQEMENIDNLVDIPGEIPTKEPFVILTEIVKNEDISGDNYDEEIIIVVVKAPVYIIHDFKDLPESGDIIQKDVAVPGSKYIAYPLSGDKYPIVDNYKNDGVKTIKSVSRISGDKINTVTINYTRIKIDVDYNSNGARGTTPNDFEIAAGESKEIEYATSLEKVGHYFAGWSGDNGIVYQSGDKFEAVAGNEKHGAAGDDNKVILYAIWKPKSYKVKISSGDYIDDVAFMSGDDILSLSGERIYKYGEKVEIKARLKPDRKGYENVFVTWSGDSLEDLKNDDDFNKVNAKTFFTMPATDITLEAVAKENVLKTSYKVIYYLESFVSGDYVEHETIEGSGDTDKVLVEDVDYEVKRYQGFEYQSSLTTPSGDKKISAEKELEIKLYYKRLSYDLELISGDRMITYLSGNGRYKYGQEVTIKAKTKSYFEEAKYVFDKWTTLNGDFEQDTEFNPNDSETTFTMPANNLKLKANSSKIDVTFISKNIDGFTEKNIKDYPEPGDIVTYTVKLKNTGDKDTKINLGIVAPSGDILRVTIDNGEEREFSGNSIEISSLEIDKTEVITVTFEVRINSDFEVKKDNDFIVNLNAETIVDELLATEKIDITPERMVAINFRQKTNKNIVMLIDTSSSMAYCTEHPELNYEGYYGYIMLSEDIALGNYSGDYDIKDSVTGKVHAYDEARDCLFLNGDLIPNYSKKTAGSYKGHTIDIDEHSGDFCTAPSRIDVLIKSLIDSNGFVDMIAEGARINGEEVTVTIVTFSGRHDDKSGRYVANISGTFDINATNLKNEIRNIKFDLHHGTYVNSGLDEVVKLFTMDKYKSKLLSGDNVENHFIFFGDGKASDSTIDRASNIATLITGESAYFDYSYAIGFGSDFVKDSEGEVMLDSLLKKPSDSPIKASNENDIIDAFASIARNISAISQTDEGILKISGEAFNDAVESDKVFPIALFNGNTKLFEIINESNTSPTTWKDGTTTSEFEFIKSSGKLVGIKIDLSGLPFINKNDLSVMLDCK